jgi:hypothetical protein
VCFGDKTPFHTRIKPSATPPAQIRIFDGSDNFIGLLLNSFAERFKSICEKYVLVNSMTDSGKCV